MEDSAFVLQITQRWRIDSWLVVTWKNWQDNNVAATLAALLLQLRNPLWQSSWRRSNNFILQVPTHA